MNPQTDNLSGNGLPEPPNNLATKVINTSVKVRMAGYWVGAVITVIIFVIICVPLLLIFTHKIFSNSIIFGVLFVCLVGLLPLYIIFYNVRFLRRRKWTSPHIQQPQTTSSTPQIAAPVISASPRNEIATPTQPDSTSLLPEPKLELAVPGIIKAGVVSYSYFGGATTKPEIQHPENALLVTDQALCFIYVPMPGADNQLMDTQYVTTVFNKKGIEEMLNQLLATQTVSRVVSMDTRNWTVPYNQIKKLSFSNFRRAIKIETVSGDRRSYGIKRQYWDQLKQLLATRGYS